MNQLLTDIVTKNLDAGAVLYEFGIRFYDSPGQTLSDSCMRRNIDPKVIADRLSHTSRPDLDVRKLHGLSLDLLIEYLKSAHQGYISRKLPYFLDLVHRTDSLLFPDSQLANDLKFIFPIFVEDFIHHIYEEEDEVFHYILTLQGLVREGRNPVLAGQLMEEWSIRSFAMDHDMGDDEMAGIRAITEGYFCDAHTPLAVKVLYAELRKFEADLKRHAAIENEVLFPRALSLEAKARHKLQGLIAFN